MREGGDRGCYTGGGGGGAEARRPPAGRASSDDGYDAARRPVPCPGDDGGEAVAPQPAGSAERTARTGRQRRRLPGRTADTSADHPATIHIQPRCLTC